MQFSLPVIQPAVDHGTVKGPAEAWPPPFLRTDSNPVAVDALIVEVHSSHVLIIVLDALWLWQLLHDAPLLIPPLGLCYRKLLLHVGRNSYHTVVIPPDNQLLSFVSVSGTPFS